MRNEEKKQLKCNIGHCSKHYQDVDGAISNMIRHLRTVHGITKEKKLAADAEEILGPLDVYKSQAWTNETGRVTRELWLEQLIKFLITSHSPWSLVKNPEFLKLILMTQRAPNLTVVDKISDNAIKTQITDIYELKKVQIISLLQQQPSLCFTVDMWSSAWGHDYLGITVHFIDESWQQRELMLGLEHPYFDNHTGANLAQLFMSVLDDFGIADKLFTITSDNASNMVAMAREIENICRSRSKKPGSRVAHFRKNLHHILCLGHILNLAAQALIKKSQF